MTHQGGTGTKSAARGYAVDASGFILRETLKYLTNQRIVASGYTTLQDMVSRVVSG
ncbi:MAG: hypothetical protein PHG00_17500 [Methylococcales bacterium]|nr:hypothetical protein [Methylococcales bacterium]